MAEVTRTDAALSRLAEEAVATRLARDGFAKRAKGVFALDIGCGERTGWLGTSHSRQHGRIEVDVYVGVHDSAVESLVDRLQGRRHRPLVERTFAVPLHHVAGGPYRPYVVGRSDAVDDAAAVERLGQDVQRYGVPAMKALCERTAVANAIESAGLQNELLYRLPVILALSGDKQRAVKLVRDLRREYADVTEAARAYGRPEYDYDAFAERFVAELEADDSSQG